MTFVVTAVPTRIWWLGVVRTELVVLRELEMGDGLRAWTLVSLKRKSTGFRSSPVEIIVSVAALNAFAFWAKGGRHERSVVTLCPLRL